MGVAPTNQSYERSLKERVSHVLQRALDAIRKVPVLTSSLAIAGLLLLVLMTTRDANQLLEETPENWSLHYKLALSDRAQQQFLVDFFNEHWKLGALLMLPALIAAVIRQRGKQFVLPLTLAVLALWGLWIVNDLHLNWRSAHFTTMGEVPAPQAYYLKLGIISLTLLSIPVLFWFYGRSTILDRYVVRSFVGPFLMCLLGIIAIMVTMDLLNNANDLLKADFSAGMVAEFYLRQMPQMLVTIMDAAILLATLYMLSRMSRANEIISMLGSGRSLVRILVPILTIGGWASLLVLAMNYEWAPGAQSVKDAMLRKADRAGDRGAAKARREQASTYNVVFRNREANRTWMLGKVPNNMLQQGLPIDFICVVQDDGNWNLMKAWYGKRASWDPGSRQWRFSDAHIIDSELVNTEEVKIPSFERLVIEENWPETPWSILSGKINPDYLGVQELASYLNSSVSLESKKLARYETTLHSRLSLPFRSFLMVLIAAPLGIVTSRRGVLGGVAYSVGIFVAVYFLFTIFLKMGESGFLAPPVAGWGVIVLFAVIGLLLITMKNYNRTFPSLNPLQWFKRSPA
jgi:lipopolysaccharide export system permease protein